MDQEELGKLEARCIQEQPAACAAACPVHVDARAMAAAIAGGDFAAAAKIFRKSVPFPGIISRVGCRTEGLDPLPATVMSDAAKGYSRQEAYVRQIYNNLSIVSEKSAPTRCQPSKSGCNHMFFPVNRARLKNALLEEL